MPTNPSSTPRGQDTNSQSMVRSYFREKGDDPDKLKYDLVMEAKKLSLERSQWRGKAAPVSTRQIEAISKTFHMLERAVGGGNAIALEEMSGEELLEIAGAVGKKIG